MPTDSELQAIETGPQFRLLTIIRLRWAAVLGQTATVLVTRFGFGFEFPWMLCLSLIAAAALSNVWLMRLRRDRARRGRRTSLEEGAVFTILAFDISQLGLLVLLTGGMTNPFAIFVMAPVMAASTTMSAGRIAKLGLLAAIFVTLVSFFYVPLPWYGSQAFDLPPLYIAGHWTAIIVMIAFTVSYAYRAAEEARRLSSALLATELVMQREQNLASLDGMAAAAAHELGTPLGTIAVVAKELTRQVDAQSDVGQDVALIHAQAVRCREILQRLSEIGVEGDAHMSRVRLSALVEDLIEPHRGFGIDIATLMDGVGREPLMVRNPSVAYALGNVIENAVDFARTRVVVSARFDEAGVSISVQDDGPGFPEAVLDRVGEPWISMRDRPPADRTSDGAPTERTSAGKAQALRDKDGLGLGVFIARTLVERSGATITFRNARSPLTGGLVSVAWPRLAVEPDFDADAGLEPADEVAAMAAE